MSDPSLDGAPSSDECASDARATEDALPEERALEGPDLLDAREASIRLAELLRGERAGAAGFLVALAEFDREQVWVRLGYPSLYSYLNRVLGLSNAAAYYRKVAAELIQRFPEVVEPLRDGRLCITSVIELARVMSDANRAEVLPRFFHLSKREARAVAVEILPAAVIPRREVVTGVESDTSAAARRNLPADPGSSAALHPGEVGSTHPAGGSPASSMSSEPLDGELCRLHVTVSKKLLAKLDRARAGQSHAKPRASAGDVIEAALDLLLEAQAKRRGATTRPQAHPRPSGPDHVPVAVRRAVWERDGGRCRWPLEGGGTCGSTLRVELDHVVPRARGGASTVDNCRLLCRDHNDLAARLAFGDDWMDQFTPGMGH
jgi:5-methylcytosine-specific restriction endonuclease McrA